MVVLVLLGVLLLLSGLGGFDRSGIEEKLVQGGVSGRCSDKDAIGVGESHTPVQNWTKLKNGSSNCTEKAEEVNESVQIVAGRNEKPRTSGGKNV